MKPERIEPRNNNIQNEIVVHARPPCRIVFSVTHKRVTGPYHVVHSENWAVYTYFNEKSRRAELASLELFEGKTQNNATVFSSLHSNISPLVSKSTFLPAYRSVLSK